MKVGTQAADRCLIGVVILAVLAACGGGGSTTPSGQRAPALFAGTPAPPAANRTSVGTLQLTLTLPHVFTGTNVQALGARRRGPAYINPIAQCEGCLNVLDIYVDGSLIANLDGEIGPDHSLYVQNTNDGTQNVSLPLFSTSTNDIVVVEYNSYISNVLAMGETQAGGFPPGTGVNATITLLMNAAYVGILDIHNQQDPEVMSGQTYFGLEGSCGSPNQGLLSQFGLYAADVLGTFVPVAGYGGTSTPVESSASDPGGTTRAGQTGVPGIYEVDWDAHCLGVTVTATTANPAHAIFADVYGNGSGGPFTANGQPTYGYVRCYEGSGPCPGGPYQGIWTLVYPINDGFWYPLVAGIYNLATVSGSVDILNAPTPSPVPIASPTGSSGGVSSSPVPLPSTPGGSGGVSSSPIPI